MVILRALRSFQCSRLVFVQWPVMTTPIGVGGRGLRYGRGRKVALPFLCATAQIIKLRPITIQLLSASAIECR